MSKSVQQIELRVGDCVYFKPNHALGVLLGRRAARNGAILWKYALRSPPPERLENVMVSIREDDETLFIQGITKGRLTLYEVGRHYQV